MMLVKHVIRLTIKAWRRFTAPPIRRRTSKKSDFIGISHCCRTILLFLLHMGKCLNCAKWTKSVARAAYTAREVKDKVTKALFRWIPEHVCLDGAVQYDTGKGCLWTRDFSHRKKKRNFGARFRVRNRGTGGEIWEIGSERALSVASGFYSYGQSRLYLANKIPQLRVVHKRDIK